MKVRGSLYINVGPKATLVVRRAHRVRVGEVLLFVRRPLRGRGHQGVPVLRHERVGLEACNVFLSLT